MAESRAGDIFQPGDLLNSTYRIEAILGRGGTSEVYRARNEISGRFVAIKVLKSEFSGDEAFLTLMRREEEIREIRHDAVVRYSENHRTPEGLIYLVMDYVEGPGLDRLMRDGGLPADALVRVCRRVAAGLQAAHARRIVHRDLSPDNIILKGGSPDEAVIIDFGIAKDANPGAQTIVGNEFAGKYAYAAPEQLAGQADPRTDLYSLGALLLATFRGKQPDSGANPMEVLKRKQQPLDTTGVPDPLKSLIDKMTDPDPARRYQSADELLNAIDDGTAPAPEDDHTIVVRPPTTTPPSPAPAAALSTTTGTPANPYVSQSRPAMTTPPPEAKAAATPQPRSRGGLWLVLVLVLIVGGGAGAYFSGALNQFLAPALPLASPYKLVIERPATGAPKAMGDVPSKAISTQLNQAMTAIGGTAKLTLASGKIGRTWGKDVLSVVKALGKLDSWRVAVTGDTATVTGSTSEKSVHDAVMAAIGTLPGVLKGTTKITVVPKVPLFLNATDVKKVLKKEADCGPLTLVDPPAAGYGKGATISVTGQLAQTRKQVQLYDALSAIAPQRKINLKIDLLNPALCQIESTLPALPRGNMSFDFGFGKRKGSNPSGRYFVGENPVIDLVLPADVTSGYVSVSIIDVSGKVYHLLPNINRQDNSVATLRHGRTGKVKVRIAYPLSDNAKASHVAFTIDGSTLGKSKVIVLHSAKPLFAQLRPTTESVGGFADALKQEVDSGKLSVLSMDSRILTSVAAH